MATRLALRIQERFEELSPAEQKLAAFVLDRTDEILTWSATELAGMAGVSKATAARLFRSLGYSDFNEVRLQAREERNRTGPIQRVARPAGAPREAASLAEHLKIEVANLSRTFEELRSDALQALTDRLASVPRLWVLGMGAEEGLARLARLLLARVRPGVHLLAGQAGAWAEDLAMTGAHDGLLVLATRPQLRVMRPILDYARTTRLEIVMLTDPTSAATARRLGALVLPCHAMGQQAGPSHTAMLSAVHLIAGTIAARLGRGAASRLELIAEIHEELDDLE
jgi:DNA-binding MurR/RpiR family transcriptional regulator